MKLLEYRLLNLVRGIEDVQEVNQRLSNVFKRIATSTWLTDYCSMDGDGHGHKIVLFNIGDGCLMAGPNVLEMERSSVWWVQLQLKNTPEWLSRFGVSFPK